MVFPFNYICSLPFLISLLWKMAKALLNQMETAWTRRC